MKQRIIDHVEFAVKAGNGGRGVVSFRREKYVARGGPDGGDGGNGGSIYLVSNPHISTLIEFAGRDRYEAVNGDAGRSRRQHGKDAKDMVLEVPVGTVVFTKTDDSGDSDDTGDSLKNNSSEQSRLITESSNRPSQWQKVADMNQPGMKVLIAQGGAGGRGNDAFKSSINTTPMVAEPGVKGEYKNIKLELKVLADIGLVGLPNAGKSTLLSVLTAARPEIANYPFTTITPNLGVLDMRNAESVMRKQDNSITNHESRITHLVIADIPGLIEDASKGKGLGIDFLKHIERCRALVYVISPTDEDLDKIINYQLSIINSLLKQFEIVRHEVQEYGHGVDDKKRMVVINKIDILSTEQVKEVVTAFEKLGEKVVVVSAATGKGIPELKQILIEF